MRIALVEVGILVACAAVMFLPARYISRLDPVESLRFAGPGIFDTPHPVMIIHENILGAIGNTPMIRMNQIAEDFPCPVDGGVLQSRAQRGPDGPEHGRAVPLAGTASLSPAEPSSNAPRATRAWASPSLAR